MIENKSQIVPKIGYRNDKFVTDSIGMLSSLISLESI